LNDFAGVGNTNCGTAARIVEGGQTDRTCPQAEVAAISVFIATAKGGQTDPKSVTVDEARPKPRAGPLIAYLRGMDGGDQLRRPRRKDVATLAVHGTTFRSHVPPQPPVERVLASHAAAVAAMNAELVGLTSKGWEVDDVETATDASSPAEPRPDELDAVLTSLVRERSRVTIDASESVVTRDQALAALLGELSKGCAELVIQDAQPCDAPWYQTVAPWCSALASLGSRELERLVVDTYFETLTRQARVHCGDVTQVFRACPSLKFAYVIGCAEIHALAHDRLEDLTLMAEPLDVDTLRAVLRPPVPG
jgi:hypothetical protein